jgi:hypothetical protein
MNREIFPGGIYPLQGDVTSQAGANDVVVTGIQNTPVDPTPPLDQQVLQYSQTAKEYVPSSLTFLFDQASASATWVIVHNLNKYPSVTIFDSTGREVKGQINYDSLNQVTLTFTAAFSGQASLM